MVALVLLAVSVGLSNFAGAIGIGVPGTDASIRWRVGVVFGAFEAGMPIVGLAVGHHLTARLGGVTRWAGAALLIGVGCYALVDVLRSRDSWCGPNPSGDSGGRHHATQVGDGPCDAPKRDRHADVTGQVPRRTSRLLLVGLALSIDNLAVGFALGALGTAAAGILVSALVIGGVSVLMSLVGLELGARIGAAAGRKSELFGAMILITVAAGIGMGVI